MTDTVAVLDHALKLLTPETWIRESKISGKYDSDLTHWTLTTAILTGALKRGGKERGHGLFIEVSFFVKDLLRTFPGWERCLVLGDFNKDRAVEFEHVVSLLEYARATLVPEERHWASRADDALISELEAAQPADWENPDWYKGWDYT